MVKAKTRKKRVRPLTTEQERTIRFWIEFVRVRGYQPSTQDAMKHLGFTSPGSVTARLKGLASKGFIRLDTDKRKRCVQILKWPDGRQFLGFERPTGESKN